MADARAVLTVLGADRVGIVAGVSGVLADLNVNIEDIRMALLGQVFTMIAMVNVGDARAPFAEIQAALTSAGQELGVQVMLQREETFQAMQRI
jgi:ACT domain-containing protein